MRNSKCGFFKTIKETSPSRLIETREMYNDIRSGQYKNEVNYIIEKYADYIQNAWKDNQKLNEQYQEDKKRLLPAYLPAGIHSRKIGTIIKPEELSGIVNGDLDEDSKEVLEVFHNEKCKEIPFIEAVWYSLSGKYTGALSVIFAYDVPESFDSLPEFLKNTIGTTGKWLQKYHTLVGNYCKDFLEKSYHIRMSPAKDSSRLRYVSYDPTIYVNPHVVPISLDTIADFFTNQQNTLNNEENEPGDLSAIIRKHKKNIKNLSKNYSGEVSPSTIMDYLISIDGEPKEGNRTLKFVKYYFLCLHRGIEIDSAIATAKQYGGDYEKIGTYIYSQYGDQLNQALESYYKYELTELGNAQYFADLFGDKVRYSQEENSFYVYNGQYWEKESKRQILRLAFSLIEEMKNNYNKLPQKSDIFRNWIKSSQSNAKLSATIKLAQAQKDIPIRHDDFDNDLWLLNVQNGTLDLKTSELRAHNPEDYIRWYIDIPYSSDAKCVRWIQFLDEIFKHDQELINYVQKILGYAITGDVKEQCLFILYGDGLNGKSTLLNTILTILGNYSTKLPSNSIMRRKNESIPNDIARLHKKRFVYINETEEDVYLSEALVKQITSSEKINARFLFKEYFDFIPSHKTFIGTNHRPNISETKLAIWRRIKPIPFMYTIPEDKRDSKLEEKLMAEKEGILAWLVEGNKKYQIEGLQEPDTVKNATENYKSENDVLQRFIEECCDVAEDCKIPSSKLYDGYKEWADTNGEKVLSNKLFTLKMKEKGFSIIKTADCNKFFGIDLSERFLKWKQIKNA